MCPNTASLSGHPVRPPKTVHFIPAAIVAQRLAAKMSIETSFDPLSIETSFDPLSNALLIRRENTPWKTSPAANVSTTFKIALGLALALGLCLVLGLHVRLGYLDWSLIGCHHLQDRKPWLTPNYPRLIHFFALCLRPTPTITPQSDSYAACTTVRRRRNRRQME